MYMEMFLALAITGLLMVFIVDGSQKRRTYLAEQREHIS